MGYRPLRLPRLEEREAPPPRFMDGARVEELGRLTRELLSLREGLDGTVAGRAGPLEPRERSKRLERPREELELGEEEAARGDEAPLERPKMLGRLGALRGEEPLEAEDRDGAVRGVLTRLEGACVLEGDVRAPGRRLTELRLLVERSRLEAEGYVGRTRLGAAVSALPALGEVTVTLGRSVGRMPLEARS